MDPLIIVPARAGSKGIPGKNTRPLAGMSPLGRAIACAQAIEHATIIVTTDYKAPSLESRVMASDAADMTVWYHRPAALASDNALMTEVVLDVFRAFPGPDDQSVLLIQPTQPLRTPWHLQRALSLLHRYPRVASVVETEPAQKLWYTGFEPVAGPPVTRRQDARQTWRCDGTVYGFRRHAFMDHPVFVTPLTHMLIIDPAESCALDTSLDWELAELRLQDARL